MYRSAGADVVAERVLELLQSAPELPLPTRYAIEEAASGPILHAVASRTDRRAAAHLEERAGRLGLPLHGIVLVGDPTELPAPCPVRADLLEHTLERAGRDRAAPAPEGAVT